MYSCYLSELPTADAIALERTVDAVKSRLKSIVDEELGVPGMVDNPVLPAGVLLHRPEHVHEGAEAGELLEETAEKYDELYGRAMDCVERPDLDGLFEVAEEAINYNLEVGGGAGSGPLGELANFCLRAIGCHLISAAVEENDETNVTADDILKHNLHFRKSILELHSELLKAVKKDVGEIAEEDERIAKDLAGVSKDITNAVTAVRVAPNAITLEVKTTDSAVHLLWVSPRGRLAALWEQETEKMRHRYRETKKALKEAIRELEDLL